MAGLELIGTLQKAETPAWGYGTHLIDVNGEVFALVSDTVELDEYVGQDVRLIGESVEGYPLGGQGPLYLAVTEVGAA